MTRIEPRITALTAQRLAAPVWHILRIRSGREATIADRLAIAGIETAYPTRTTTWRDRQDRICERVFAEVPGLIFAKFRARPVWHEFRARNLITGVVWQDRGHGPEPYLATQNDVRRWMGIPTVEEELEAARLEALRVHPGDKARVLVGDDLSLAVTVLEVKDGVVRWESLLGKGSSPEGKCEKVA